MLLDMKRKADETPHNPDGQSPLVYMMMALSGEDKEIVDDEYDIMFDVLSTGERKTYLEAFEAAEPIIIERMTKKYGRA